MFETFFCMTSHLIKNMRALARAHGETFDFLLENLDVLVHITMGNSISPLLILPFIYLPTCHVSVANFIL